ATALALVVGAGIVHVVAGWNQAANGIASRLGAATVPLLGFVLGAIALARVARRNGHEAAPWALVAGLVLLIGVGIGDVLDLVRSQLPSSLPASVTRSLVAFAIGAGAGCVTAAAA